jgi:hypothetical protein
MLMLSMGLGGFRPWNYSKQKENRCDRISAPLFCRITAQNSGPEIRFVYEVFFFLLRYRLLSPRGENLLSGSFASTVKPSCQRRHLSKKGTVGICSSKQKPQNLEHLDMEGKGVLVAPANIQPSGVVSSGVSFVTGSALGFSLTIAIGDRVQVMAIEFKYLNARVWTATRSP